jgi:penicillin-binding protein 1C
MRIARLVVALGLAAVVLMVAPRLTPVPDWFVHAPSGGLVLLDRRGEKIADTNLSVTEADGAGGRGAVGAPERTGRGTAVRRGAGGRAVLLDQVDPLLIRATLAAEDRRFYHHPGIDPLALARAVRQCVLHDRSLRGASTLTMQVVRLARGQPRGLASRLGEVWWSFVLESHLEKREILETYLNHAPYGPNLRGVAAGSQRWFGKPPGVLSPAEAALLAAIPRAPSRLDPGRHPGAARAARDMVLARMTRCGWLAPEEADRARACPLDLVSAAARPAPHFTAWVLDAIDPDGPPPATVKTSLDSATQILAERALRDRIASLTGRVRGGAVVVLDTQSAAVRAMVGSRAFDAHDAGQVNAALSPRQPGSAVKPFTYVVAFAGSLRPSTILADVPTSYENPTGVFSPRNYAGGFAGPVPARLALANSWNVPTVEVLHRTGLAEVMRGYEAVGLARSADEGRLGLGLTLGAGEVTLLDLAAAYSTLARGGTWEEPHGILEERAKDGSPIPLAEWDSHPALDRVSCAWVNAILSDPAARSVAFDRGGPLEIDGPVAAKTGTSSDWRDAWAVLYTTRHTVAVWMGNPDGSPTDGVTGAQGPAVIARTILESLEATEPSDPFPVPDGIERRAVCPLSGCAVGPDCPQIDWAPFRTGDPALSPCDVHVTRRIDVVTGRLARTCTPNSRVRITTFVRLPERFSFWQVDRGLPAPPGSATDCLCGSPSCRLLDVRESIVAPREPDLAILRPVDGTVIALDPTLAPGQQMLALEAVAPAKAVVEWLVDGTHLGEADGSRRIFWPARPGEHRIEARILRGDEAGEERGQGAAAASRVRVLEGAEPAAFESNDAGGLSRESP